MATENFTKLENLDKNSEIESQVTEELTNLGISVKEFYEVNQDKVNFKTEVVKEYFNKLKDDANIKGKTSKESWQYLVSDNKRFTTCIMAMQIALESMGYEIQKIDGRLGKNTKAGIKRFQTQCGLSLKDGFPGQETITKLSEALANPTAFEAKQEYKPATVKASSSSSSSSSSSGGSGGTESGATDSSSSATSAEKQPGSAVEVKKDEYGNEFLEYLNNDKEKPIYKIQSIDKLPEVYRGHNGGQKKEIYRYVDNGDKYDFFANGYCNIYYKDGRSDVGAHSQSIYRKLKNGRADDEKYGKDLNLFIPEIKNLVKGKTISVGGKEYSIFVGDYIVDGRKVGDNVLDAKVKFYAGTNDFYQTKFSVGDLLDGGGNFNSQYFNDVLLGKVKKNLESQIKAQNVMENLNKKKKVGYSMEELVDAENRNNAKYLRYFNDMDSKTKKVTFDDISRDGDNIKFSLDNDGSNKDYNKLTVKYTELADGNGNFNENRLKAYLKKKIKEIVEKNY